MRATRAVLPTSVQLLGDIRSGALSAEALMRASLAQVDATRDQNAFISVNSTLALEAARKVDEKRAAGLALRRLEGLPIVVKDNINTRDLPTTAGTPALQHAQPATNAPSLQRLLDSGAIVLGKTNMHEMAFGVTSSNLAVFAGPVRNPHNTAHISGGSSGGTAAAIAVNCALSGLGTDTGGSTRIPAALCGIVGVRPSVGNGGAERRYHDHNAVVPISNTRDTIGPMGRTVVDVALLDSVITQSPLVSRKSLHGLRVGLPSTFWKALDDDVATVMERAKAALVDAGVTFVPVDTAALSELNRKTSMAIVMHEPYVHVPHYLRANGLSVTLADIVKRIASPDVRALYDTICTQHRQCANSYTDAMRVWRPQLQRAYADAFSAHHVEAFLFPTTSFTATVIDAERGSTQDQLMAYARNTDAASNAGIPGISIPAGTTAAALPVGMELDGPLGTDRNLMAICMSIEEQFTRGGLW